MATNASLKQTIAHVENWIRSGAAARDVEKLAQALVKRASERVPPAALKRLIVLIERLKPLAERATRAARGQATRVAPLVRRPAVKKAAAKKAAAKKGVRKAAVKKAATRKGVRKVAAKKGVAKKAAVKRAGAKKAGAKKAGARKAAPRRTAAKKATKQA